MSEVFTEVRARRQLEWRNLGQENGVKTQLLFFFLRQEDKGTGAAMCMSRITLFVGSSGWQVNDDSPRYPSVTDAKRAAVDAAMLQLRADGWIT